jgi:hypothetical protein
VICIDIIHVWSVVCCNIVKPDAMQRVANMQRVDVLELIRASKYSGAIVKALAWWMFVVPSPATNLYGSSRDDETPTVPDNQSCTCRPGWVLARPDLARLDLLEAAVELIDEIHRKVPGATGRERNRKEYNQLMLDMCQAAKEETTLIVSAILLPLLQDVRRTLRTRTWNPRPNMAKHEANPPNMVVGVGVKYPVSEFDLLSQRRVLMATISQDDAPASTVRQPKRRRTDHRPTTIAHIQDTSNQLPSWITFRDGSSESVYSRNIRQRTKSPQGIPSWVVSANSVPLPKPVGKVNDGLLDRWKIRMDIRKDMRTTVDAVAHHEQTTK